nr:serine/threonine-protein kinase PEPKR2 [Tanacetum cinerariifolium]
LFKSNGHLNIRVYTDADWAGDKGNRRSTSRYFSLVTLGLMMKKRKGSDLLCPVDKKKDKVESMGDSESLISNLKCHYSSEDYVRIKKRRCKEDVACSVEGVSGSRKIVATAMPCATSLVVLN